MLETVKAYIQEDSEQFEDYYQKYIFMVQDINLDKEVSGVKPSDILSLDKLIAKLHKELLGN